MTTGTWAAAARRLWRNRLAACSLVGLGLIALACVVGPWLAPHSGEALDFASVGTAPSLDDGHWFGTDNVGRDLFARTLEGGRVSLLVGLLATLVSVVIGVAWGAIAGYFGGRVDALMMRAVDILYALPFMFLVILLMVLFGRHFALVFVAIGAINWLDMARIVRGQTLSLRRREFVDAARLAGAPPLAIVRGHIVPNLLGVVVVYATLTVPQVILVESFLSFLGLGVQEPATSWGVLVNDGAADMEVAPWALLFPAGFLAATLLCLNFLGDALRDVLDPNACHSERSEESPAGDPSSLRSSG
jgi:oligopeptide transport system permease protein